MRLFLLGLMCLLLHGCAKPSGNTKLTVSRSFAFGGSELAPISGGGLIVWGKSDKGESFARTLEGTDSINLNLNNGKWTFYGLAWDGSKNYSGGADPGSDFRMGGNVFCAISNTFDLTGESKEINFTLAALNCEDPIFRGGAPLIVDSLNRQLPPVAFTFCDSVSSINNLGDLCNDEFGLNPAIKARRAAVSSYKVLLRSFDVKNGNKNYLPGAVESECLATNPIAGGWNQDLHGTNGSVRMNLPAGGPGLPFDTQIRVFQTLDCDQASTSPRGPVGINLPEGFAGAAGGFAGASPVKNYVDTVPTDDTHSLSVAVSPVAVCSGRGSTTQPGHKFAGGLGTLRNPYVICSVPQLRAINELSIHLNDSTKNNFKLQANLNFNPFSKGLANAGFLNDDCLEVGNNFFPIGYLAPTDCSNQSWGTLTPFLGTLTGSGFALQNFRIRAEEQPRVGLFGEIGVSARIMDLQLINGEVHGESNIGAIAGRAMGSGAGAQLRSIKVKDVRVSGRQNGGLSNTGGLVGYATDTTFKDIIATGLKVRGDGSNVGGVVGTIVGNSALDEVAVEANIEAFGNQTSPSSIGGLAGLSSSTTIVKVKHEGGIYTDGREVGGIVGSANGTTSLEKFYSISAVDSTDGSPSVNLGGVVGRWNSTGNYGDGYTLSHVNSECQGSTCQIGGSVGIVATPPTNAPAVTYRLLNNISGHNVSATSNFFANESTISLSMAEQASTFTNLNTDWVKPADQYPRFVFEKHPCPLNPAGTGTATSPKSICRFSDYLLAASDVSATRNYKLFANIRLNGGLTTQFDHVAFRGHLNGDGKAFIGGSSNVSGLATPNDWAQTAHIETLYGSLRNVNYLGHQRFSKHSSDPNHRSALLVKNNEGIIEKVNVRGKGVFESGGAAIVARNFALKTVGDVKFKGKLVGHDRLAGLISENFGTLKNSKFDGEMKCISIPGPDNNCDLFAGLVSVNSGVIQKSTIEMELSDSGPNTTSFFAGIVSTNTAGALVQDVVVSDESRVRLNGTSPSPSFFASNHAPGATFRRVINNGQLLLANETQGASGGLGTFPISEIRNGAGVQGTYTDVLRGGKSGQLLADYENYSCVAATGIVTIPSWPSSLIATSGGWDAFLGAGSYNGLSPVNKKLVLELESDVDFSRNRILQVLSYPGSGGFGVALGSTNGCVDTDVGKAKLYWTNDIPVNVADGYNPIAGVITPPFSADKLNYDSAFNNPFWSDLIWDESAVDETEKLNYFIAILSGTPTSILPATWELYENELELFNNDPNGDD